MSEQPPPYRPFFPEGPPLSPGFCPPPTAYPGSTYQTFPQSFPASDHTIYQPGHVGPPGVSVIPPGYYGDHRGNQHHPSHPPKPSVMVVDQRPDQPQGSFGSYLAACSAALCCCCLWDLLHR
ncbi:cysteine-rich and transmembrane domain-containing protein 1-like isoform X2 [Cyprinodon tularosa]|nr:cysteine-rich and transmembrane domain-containing protein 1-like isoform X2 [Cyprinodon tularosa]XP_038156619.1 cysteine-rich and transmembrane domain-containing protein 1-like isoform X2 [Cyprinodon tularosa]XP_038156620.1 cysteine-rich and transmembrane domain-containing protein 1-like isoform X2 [Cyprinodon tularosa]XP_038156621.1 cysteine-rich and transmembrane domain-containing protein 1-like isoform X2 [Cyprinodon tularosa]XP_038156622.1 cysteine-rich and transmembrane domain-containin